MPNATPLKLALVGCGHRGREHLRAAVRAERFELVAAADVDAKRLGALAGEFGVQRSYDDYRAMLKAEARIDVLHLCTQPTLRLAAVEAALAAGVRAIVVEKPMALRYGEALHMQERCAQAGALLVVNHQKRNMAEWIALKEALLTGRIGQVTALRASCYGNLLSQGTHMLDQAWNVLGEPRPLWVLAGLDARVSEAPHHAAPRNALLLVAFEGGVRGSFVLGNDSPAMPNARSEWFWCNIEVLGTEGRVEAVLDRGFRRYDGKGELVEELESHWDDTFQGAAQTRLSAEVARALCEPGFVHPQRGEAALVSFGLLEAACRSALAGGKPIELPLETGVEALAHWSGASGPAGS